MRIASWCLLLVPCLIGLLATPARAGVKNQIQQLDAKISGVRTTVNAIKARTDFIPNNRDPKVRDLFTELEPGRIQELFEMFRQGTNPTEALELIKVLRDAGFPAFRDSPSQQQEMRDNLKGILNSIDRIRNEIKELRCYFDPDREPVRSTASSGKIASFIDVLPPVVLYAMQKMLDEFTDGTWPTLLDPVGVPAPLIEGESLCNDAGTVSGVRNLQVSSACAPSFDERVCGKLRDPDLGELIREARERVNFAKLLFGTIAEWLPDEAVIGATITVVGGGGAVKNVPVKASTVFKTVANLMDLLERMLGNQLSRRADCIAADEAMERDLLQCTALAAYDLDGFCPVQDLALRRAGDLGKDDTALRDAMDFTDLCAAYQDLR